MGIDAVFSVIAERTRRDILESLRAEGKSVGQLVGELGVSQPTVSKHLKVLREAGLVTMRAQGQKRFYSLEAAPLVTVQDWIAGIMTEPAAAAPEAPEAPVAPEAPPAALVGPAAPVAGPVPERPEADAPAAEVLAAVALAPAGSPRAAAEATRQQQIGRTMGRAAERAADLISQLRRRKDSER
ncbi:ArsR/SmtB family transcription factor [Arthrobacter sp. TMN-37]